MLAPVLQYGLPVLKVPNSYKLSLVQPCCCTRSVAPWVTKGTTTEWYPASTALETCLWISGLYAIRLKDLLQLCPETVIGRPSCTLPSMHFATDSDDSLLCSACPNVSGDQHSTNMPRVSCKGAQCIRPVSDVPAEILIASLLKTPSIPRVHPQCTTQTWPLHSAINSQPALPKSTALDRHSVAELFYHAWRKKRRTIECLSPRDARQFTAL